MGRKRKGEDGDLNTENRMNHASFGSGVCAFSLFCFPVPRKERPCLPDILAAQEDRVEGCCYFLGAVCIGENYLIPVSNISVNFLSGNLGKC